MLHENDQFAPTSWGKGWGWLDHTSRFVDNIRLLVNHTVLDSNKNESLLLIPLLR